MRAKWRLFIDEYFKNNLKATPAYQKVYNVDDYWSAAASASRLLKSVKVAQEIEKRLKANQMGADEILSQLSQQARSDLGDFFDIREEWTYYPLASYDILDAKEEIDESDPDKPVKRVNYLVRHVVLNAEKLKDPRYSHLLHKFSDSPTRGLGIEIYNKQTALQTLAKIHGMIVDRSDITSGGEPIKADDVGLNRAVSTLADAIREAVSRPDASEDGALDAAEQASVASPAEPGG